MWARIRIDTERVIGDIGPKIWGNFAEHLGRCIEGGIFDEHSPLSESNGYRRDVLDAACSDHLVPEDQSDIAAYSVGGPHEATVCIALPSWKITKLPQSQSVTLTLQAQSVKWGRRSYH